MRDDYKITGETAKIEIAVEAEVAAKLKKMSEYTKLSVSEIANTALKRFISTHKDFLPPKPKK